MKEKLNKNLTNIRHFLSLLRTENPTQEEVVNFLFECKTYVFNQYGLNENDYDISLQFVHPKELDFDEAKMSAEENNSNKFTITLNKQKLLGKNNLVTIKRNSENKKYEQNSDNLKLQHNNRIRSILTLTQSFLHELGHVMIYITNPKAMKREDELKDNLYDTFEQVCFLMPNNKKTRLIIKALGKHINALAYMSMPEKDANRKYYIYITNILMCLISVEEDEEMLNFLSTLYLNFNRARKLNHKLYRQYSKENREAINKLHDLNFEQELENLTKELEKSLN